MRVKAKAALFRRVLLVTVALCTISIFGLTLSSGPLYGKAAWSHYPSSLCQQNNTEVVLAIRSAADRTVQRDAIRRSIANAFEGSVLHAWQFFFYMGSTNDQASINRVSAEIARHGNILVSHLLSTVDNSADIALDAVRWVLERCGRRHPIRLFVHTNDTVFVNLGAVEEYARSVYFPVRPAFYCKPAKGADTSLRTDLAWYTAYLLYRENLFPPFCEGDAYFVHGPHLASLYATTLHVRRYASLVQYLVAQMAVADGLDHVDISHWVGMAGDPKQRQPGEKVPPKTEFFTAGVLNDTWKDVWNYMLYEQARQSELQKNLTEMIIRKMNDSSKVP